VDGLVKLSKSVITTAGGGGGGRYMQEVNCCDLVGSVA
jgi:hypothetical protein